MDGLTDSLTSRKHANLSRLIFLHNLIIFSFFQGIILRDLDHTDAIASITAGGVGFSYANMRLKSDRGSGLNYQIEVYV